MRTMTSKLGPRSFWGIALSLGVFFLFGQSAIAGESIDPARSSSSPVTSATASNLQGQNTVNPNQNTLNSEPSTLSPATDLEKKDSGSESSVSQLADSWGKMNLSDAEKADLAQKLGDVFQLSGNTTNDQSLSNSYSDAAAIKIFNNLATFVETHKENNGVAETVLLALNYFVERLDKKIILQKDILRTKDSRQLFEELLKSDNTDLPQEKNPKEATISQTKAPQTPEEKADQTKHIQKTIDTVMEVLRRGAVNDQAPAMQRAIYRTWYLSLAKKSRVLRLNRVHLLAAQKYVEEFKPGSAYQ